MKSQIGSEVKTTVYQETLMKGKFDESGSHRQTKTTTNSKKYYQEFIIGLGECRTAVCPV